MIPFLKVLALNMGVGHRPTNARETQVQQKAIAFLIYTLDSRQRGGQVMRVSSQRSWAPSELYIPGPRLTSKKKWLPNYRSEFSRVVLVLSGSQKSMSLPTAKRNLSTEKSGQALRMWVLSPHSPEYNAVLSMFKSL